MFPSPQDKQGAFQEDPLEEMMDVASATECTGLIPAPPANEAEAESYTELYPIPQPPKPPQKHRR